MSSSFALKIVGPVDHLIYLLLLQYQDWRYSHLGMQTPLGDAEDVSRVWNAEPSLLPDLSGIMSSEILAALAIKTVHRIYAIA